MTPAPSKPEGTAGDLLGSGLRRRVIVANQIDFQVVESGGGDRLVLFLHGFPETSLSWRFQLALVESLGFAGWAPDLRGYGATTRPSRREDYDVELLLADIAGLIDASGVEHIVLVGHDWGGLLAWLFAIRRVRPLDALVVVNFPHPGAAIQNYNLAQCMRSWYVFFFQLPWIPEKLLGMRRCWAIAEIFRRFPLERAGFPADVVEEYRSNAARLGALTAMLRYYRALIFGGGLRRQAKLGFPELDTPTLLLWGEEDRFLSKRTLLGTGNFVSELEIRTIPRASHWPHEEAPSTTNQVMASWLRSHWCV